MSDYTCPWCSTTEPNAYLLGNNHWVKPEGHEGYDWCADHGMCIAMDLTRNHVLYYARMLTDPSYQRDHCPCLKHHPWRAECARADLRRCIARVEQVWPLPRLGWLAEYRPLADELEPPAHRPVPESVALDLFGEAAS